MRKHILVLAVSCLLLTGCSGGVTQKEYNDLDSELQTLSLKYEHLQDDYDKLKIESEITENVSNDNNQKDIQIFIEALARSIDLDKVYSGNIIADGIVQINILADGSPRDELDYYKKLIVDNYDAIKLLCDTYDVKYLYFKVVDGISGNVIFELYCNFEDEFKLTMSVGLDYIDELNK